jgi:hypothetical protein
MKRSCLPVIVSFKVEGKLLVTSRILWIIGNAHKEFPIGTFERAINHKNPLPPPCLARKDYKL